MPERDEKIQSAVTARDIVGALPAATAIFVGTLYALGVMLTSAQLVGAHLPVTDVLPLIPLQDHLTKGLGAVFSSTALATAFVATLGMFVYGYGSTRHLSEQVRDVNAAVAAAQSAAEEAERAAEASQAQATADQLRREAEAIRTRVHVAIKEGRPTSEFQDELAQLGDRAHALEREVDRLSELGKRARSHIEEARRRLDAATPTPPRGWLVRVDQRKAAQALGGLLVGFGLLSPRPGGYTILLVGAAILLGLRLHWMQYPLVVWTLIVAAWVVPFVVDEYLRPRPLPSITLTTSDGVVRGSLITESGGKYVITQRRRAWETLDQAQVRSVVVRAVKQRRPRSLVAQIFG